MRDQTQTRFILALVALTAIGSVAIDARAQAGADQAALESLGRERMARELASTAATMANLRLSSDIDIRALAPDGSEWEAVDGAGYRLTPDLLRALKSLMQEAARLDPDRPVLWRRVADVALICEDETARTEAIQQLVRIAPTDEKARLDRIMIAIDDRYQIAEERASALRWFVDEGDELGDAVRSRIAFELAILERRRDDTAAFAAALTDAMTLDPANREAAATAYGFFRQNVDDPVDEAELLINLLHAAPTDPWVQYWLAELLLEHGAWPSARRMLDLARRRIDQGLNLPQEYETLLVDLALANWALGDVDAALRVIRTWQLHMNEVAQRERAMEDEEWSPTPTERASVVGPIAPVLAMLRAAIYRVEGLEGAAEQAQLAVNSFDEAIAKVISMAERTSGSISPEAVAQERVRQAAALITLSDDHSRLDELLEEATEVRPISEVAQARFEGWKALRAGDAERAVELLLEPAREDPLASYGLAEALAELGRDAEADAQFLETAQRLTGTMLGVCARRTWEQRTAQSLPPSPVAVRLDELMETVPTTIDRLPESRSLALQVRLQATKRTLAAYEPVTLELELINTAPFPLEIGADSVIQPNVIVLVESNFARSGLRSETSPIAVDLGHRLRLEPLERLRVPIDLGLYPIGHLIMQSAPLGSLLRVRAVVNPVAVPQQFFREQDRPHPRFVAGPLGSETTSETIRVEGIPLTNPGGGMEPEPDWIEQVLADAVSGDAAARLDALAQISFWATIPGRMELLQDAVRTLPEPAAAWLVSAMPSADAVRDVVLESERPLVHISYLINHVRSSEDPVLLVALTLPEGDLRRDLAEAVLEQVAAAPQGS